ncbi:MAG TPA: MBL fold metallo-hydrolase [Planktothrix sp.]
MAILQRRVQHVFEQIQPGLWRITIHFPATVNCWLWQESDGLTLIDAGYPWNAKLILDAIESVGQPLRRIVITHAHPDHAGAAAEISGKTGAIVLAHEADIPYLQGRCMSEVPGFWLCRAVLKAGQILGMLNTPQITKVERLRDGDAVGQLRVLHTPGHTPGSISLWAEEKQAMFCGDNICSLYSLQVGVPWFTLDPVAQRAGIAKHANLPAQLLLPGHGPAFLGDIADEFQRLLAVEPA